MEQSTGQWLLAGGVGISLGVLAAAGLYLLMGWLRRRAAVLLIALGWLAVAHSVALQGMLLYHSCVQNPLSSSSPVLFLTLAGLLTAVLGVVAAIAHLQGVDGLKWPVAFAFLMAQVYVTFWFSFLLRFYDDSIFGFMEVDWYRRRCLVESLWGTLLVMVPLLEVCRPLLARRGFTSG